MNLKRKAKAELLEIISDLEIGIMSLESDYMDYDECATCECAERREEELNEKIEELEEHNGELLDQIKDLNTQVLLKEEVLEELEYSLENLDYLKRKIEYVLENLNEL